VVNPLTSRAIRTSVAFAISGGLLWFTLRAIDLRELERLLRSSSLTWIGVSLALYWLEIVIRAVRWRMLLRPIAALTFGQVLLSLVIGYAANNALPARLGEVFRAHFSASATTSPGGSHGDDRRRALAGRHRGLACAAAGWSRWQATAVSRRSRVRARTSSTG
jgi:hypothetical protein